jgi:hypothetical protein
MTTTSFPPPAAPFRVFLRRASDTSRTIASLLVVIVAARFSIAAEQAVQASSASSEQQPKRHHLPPRPSASASPEEEGPTKPSGGVMPIAANGASVRINLGVTYGPPRSEVYVNGRVVGRTPFLGDMACKRGSTIHIQIVPDVEAPLTYDRECRGGTIEIETPPP